MAFSQSPPSQSHAELLQLESQYLSRIQLGGQPSAQLGTGQERYTCREWGGAEGGRVWRERDRGREGHRGIGREGEGGRGRVEYGGGAWREGMEEDEEEAEEERKQIRGDKGSARGMGMGHGAITSLLIPICFSDFLTPLVCVEVLWPNRISKHHIIIKVYEMVGQSRDAVEMALDGWRAVRGKVGVVREDVL